MTHIDNSKIFHDAIYTDVDIFVPQKTTYKAGTVLGRNTEGKLTAFTTENDKEINFEGQEAGFKCEPLYILAQTLVNDLSSDETYTLVRVAEAGLVDKNALIFVHSGDEKEVAVLDALRKNGFRLKNIEEQTVPSPLN